MTSYMAGCICSLKSSWGSFHIWRSILSSISRKAAAMTKTQENRRNNKIVKLVPQKHSSRQPALIGS